MQLDTSKNQCRATRCHQRTPYFVQVSLGMPVDMTLENRRGSRSRLKRRSQNTLISGINEERHTIRHKAENRRQASRYWQTPYLEQESLGMPLDITLPNNIPMSTSKCKWSQQKAMPHDSRKLPVRITTYRRWKGSRDEPRNPYYILANRCRA